MKNKTLLEIKDLHVSVGEKEILHGADLTVGEDETHVLMGPTARENPLLGYAITGNPTYTVTSGDIIFDGERINDLPVNERAKKGFSSRSRIRLKFPALHSARSSAPLSSRRQARESVSGNSRKSSPRQ